MNWRNTFKRTSGNVSCLLKKKQYSDELSKNKTIDHKNQFEPMRIIFSQRLFLNFPLGGSLWKNAFVVLSAFYVQLKRVIILQGGKNITDICLGLINEIFMLHEAV